MTIQRCLVLEVKFVNCNNLQDTTRETSRLLFVHEEFCVLSTTGFGPPIGFGCCLLVAARRLVTGQLLVQTRRIPIAAAPR